MFKNQLMTLAYFTDSLVGYNIVGWRKFSFRFLTENLLHCLLTSSMAIKRFKDLLIDHPENIYALFSCLFILCLWKFQISYSVPVS